jgi:RHH-type transcriptional regulator, proline utilization regulon repressor / proline dehydrogenase / delta 1-pyrroline-5-carboxylate dehydrogenase
MASILDSSSRLPTPYRPEVAQCDRLLTCLASEFPNGWSGVAAQARPWVQAIRSNPPPFWAMESLLKEYPISSAEGLALMRLAEALLRVPDAQTAIALTADQLGRADFSASGDSTLSRLSSTAIAMSKYFLPEKVHREPTLITKLGSRTVVAATARAVQLLGKQFVLGQNIDEALVFAAEVKRNDSALSYSFDMLGEGARTADDAARYLANYRNAIVRLATKIDLASGKSRQDIRRNDGISIKLSALHPRYEYSQKHRVMSELVPKVISLAEQAAAANINLTLDAEEVDRLELSLDVFEAVLAHISRVAPQWQGFGLAMQAYQTRALDLVEHVAALAHKHGMKLMCRLVKGAYWDTEIKRAQEMGLAHYPVFTHKNHTDLSYLACAQALLKRNKVIYPQFATHNACTIAAIEQMAKSHDAAYELQRLHGMGEGVYREVRAQGEVPCRIYAPVGAHKDLLAYLVRRLLENGANSSFVHQLASDEVSIGDLLASPLTIHTDQAIALPRALFGPSRENSMGLDLAHHSTQHALEKAIRDTSIPSSTVCQTNELPARLARAQAAYAQWRKRPVKARAKILTDCADAMQTSLPELAAILVKEAFKTWGDALSEVREAIDFLRYYSQQAQALMQAMTLPGPTGESNVLELKARGVWVAISPWNFPLAIFIGQIAAALVTGNVVLAKPAEQTPGTAEAALKLLRAHGLPDDVLQLCHGPGESVGAGLVSLGGIAGVVFTGSTQVARMINRSLAAKDGPITPLIAETGGINAMIVDSTALPEQVCDAVIQSAFRSAGQRCSALRLLCLQRSIAEPVIEMIQGAMRELRLGSSKELSTDVARVIDREAYDIIASHLKGSGIGTATFQESQGLVQPQLVRIQNIAQCQAEIFGPVLQVHVFDTDPLLVVEQINALGFGLTMGIQTRIDGRAQALAQAADIGNLYINRNMIGAVVGVQPFGGEGLSGTGPKAGGPHYLLRFCSEKTISINTAAAGGNAALLTG